MEKNSADLISKELRARIKKDSEQFNNERKAALTWNIVFFISITAGTISLSLITQTGIIDFKSFFSSERFDTWKLLVAILSISISFMVGILGSYSHIKKETAKSVEIKDLIRETYLNRIEKSNLNPLHND